jgi:hypothetical protein
MRASNILLIGLLTLHASFGSAKQDQRTKGNMNGGGAGGNKAGDTRAKDGLRKLIESGVFQPMEKPNERRRLGKKSAKAKTKGVKETNQMVPKQPKPVHTGGPTQETVATIGRTQEAGAQKTGRTGGGVPVKGTNRVGSNEGKEKAESNGINGGNEYYDEK